MIPTPILVRNLSIHPPLLLAPMAGLTHSALRTVLLELGGVGLLSTEMLAARRLPMENEHLSPYLVRSKRETPLSYQLLVSDAEEVVPAVDTLHRLGADAIDLNLGCPAPRVRATGGGSLLMEGPAKARQIVARARKQTELPLTAKIRLGDAFSEQKLRDFCLMLAGEGIDLVTVHARLRKEPFGRRPHWQWVAKVKEWLSIPVIANGSLFSVADAEKCLKISGADGLMIGRGAACTPWLFADIGRELFGLDIPAQKRSKPEVYGCFVKGLLLRFVPERRLGRLKEFTHYFSSNYVFGHRLAVQVQSASSMDQAWERAMAFFSRHDEAAVQQARPCLAEVARLLSCDAGDSSRIRQRGR